MHVKLIGRRRHKIRVVEVSKILGLRNIDSLIGPEAPEVRRGMGSMMFGPEVEFTTAMVDGVGVMIGHALATQIVKGALDLSLIARPFQRIVRHRRRITHILIS
jgi:hypothetical protein